MENFDIIDQNGRPTDKIKSREDAHRDGDWHRTVHVWIMNPKRKLLIQKRASGLMAHPGMWHISVAGHIVAGDDSITTAVKETAEELGINIEPQNLECLFTVKHQCVLNKGSYISNHLNDVYLVQLDLDISKVRLQAEEVAEIKFVPFQELEQLINQKKIDMVEHDEEYEKLFQILHQRYGF